MRPETGPDPGSLTTFPSRMQLIALHYFSTLERLYGHNMNPFSDHHHQGNGCHPMHKEISREELFEQIWSKPASQLAEQYGVSDVAISKWCKRLEIPKPPRGYWAKLKVGKSVPKKPKLKELSKKGESRISTYIPSWRESQKRPKLPPAPKMIGGSLETPHRLVKCTLNALKKGRPDDRGIVRSKNKRQLDVQVTKDQIERACLIFDSLIKTLDQENMPVSLQVEKYSTSTQVDVSGTYVQLQIRERIKRTERKALKKDPFQYRQKILILEVEFFNMCIVYVATIIYKIRTEKYVILAFFAHIPQQFGRLDGPISRFICILWILLFRPNSKLFRHDSESLMLSKDVLSIVLDRY